MRNNHVSCLKYNYKMNAQFISLPRNGRIVSNTEVFDVKDGNVTPLTGTQKMEVVVVKIGNKEKLYPVWVPNQVFTDDAGQTYLLAKVETEKEVAKKAEKIGAGYIIVRDNVAEAWGNGEQVDFPSHLTNELGVRYMFVDFKSYGEVCKRVNGYCKAVKVEPVLVDASVKEGTPIESIVFGVREHDTILGAGMVLCQNKYHGETYQQNIEKLKKNYELVATDANGIQEWKPKNVVQEWTWTRENIFAVLWESFEFLSGAMININDPEDVYGCNYVVFNGNDVAPGSHRINEVYEPANPLPKAWLTEEVMDRSFDVQEGVPKLRLILGMLPETDYVEVLKPLELVAC